MITKSKQDWTVGSTVKVGFLTLQIVGAEATPGDYKPDVYYLANADGSKHYQFTPHYGLERVFAHGETA